MVSRLVLAIFALVCVQQAVAQGSCNKQADCPTAEHECRHTNFYEKVSIWPPCEHGGACVCPPQTASNSSGYCIPYVNLRLGETCRASNGWEITNSPSEICRGSTVVCATPVYREVNGFCELVPVPTSAPTNPPTVRPGPTCASVSHLDFCDNKDRCCGVSLSCELRGRNSSYNQCLCPKTEIFDGGMCRPRIYGDVCTEDSECASGLISNTGYECRLGRCRCASGYEPYTSTMFNYTDGTTWNRRVCLAATATTWVPTGSACTMEPHRFADLSGLSVCHSASFCHVCGGYTYGAGSVSTAGVCRELTCSDSGSCGQQGSCSMHEAVYDPPCNKGVCDCNWAEGYYKDRFSRCAPYRNLQLGDRCISSPMRVNNEAWDDDKMCEAVTSPSGYAGMSWGILKCKLPLIEDDNGNCVRNDDGQYEWFQALNEGDYCDDTDTRLPLKRCGGPTNEAGLSCVSNRCQCASSATCTGLSGCTASSARSVNVVYQGGMCRTTGQFGDQCDSNTDCCGGSCNNGFCGCPTNYVALTYSLSATKSMMGGRVSMELDQTTTCFKNASVVGKGGLCHLSPTTWDCGSSYIYGASSRRIYLNTQVCEEGLLCSRCPADFEPEDIAMGVCRSITSPPAPAPGADSCFVGPNPFHQMGAATSFTGSSMIVALLVAIAAAL